MPDERENDMDDLEDYHKRQNTARMIIRAMSIEELCDCWTVNLRAMIDKELEDRDIKAYQKINVQVWRDNRARHLRWMRREENREVYLRFRQAVKRVKETKHGLTRPQLDRAR